MLRKTCLLVYSLVTVSGIVAVSPGLAKAQTVTASSVERLGGNLRDVTPPVVTPVGAEIYLSPLSCLGSNGPLGAFGPLASLGPLGAVQSGKFWGLSEILGEWTGTASILTSYGGPLSSEGPLGPKGPLGSSYDDVLPKINDFAKQLQAGGVWTVLGPLGPLGALGPLGPLGPLGAHGFNTTKSGSYLDGKGNLQRVVKAPKGARVATYELFEIYDEETAKKMSDNDTSFMVRGEIGGQSDTFSFTSREDQFVTVIVVPEKSLDTFHLLVKGKNWSAVSDSDSLINWMQFKARKGERLAARIDLESSYHLLAKSYRLIVVGSTAGFSGTDIRGPHQVEILSGKSAKLGF